MINGWLIVDGKISLIRYERGNLFYDLRIYIFQFNIIELAFHYQAINQIIQYFQRRMSKT